jgi:hypothetical protein
MAKTKDRPRVRKGCNGAGLTSWIVDLRPYGKRKYFSSKDAAVGEAQIQRIRLRKEGLEGFEFTLDQRSPGFTRRTTSVLKISPLGCAPTSRLCEGTRALHLFWPRNSGILNSRLPLSARWQPETHVAGSKRCWALPPGLYVVFLLVGNYLGIFGRALISYLHDIHLRMPP